MEDFCCVCHSEVDTSEYRLEDGNVLCIRCAMQVAKKVKEKTGRKFGSNYYRINCKDVYKILGYSLPVHEEEEETSSKFSIFMQRFSHAASVTANYIGNAIEREAARQTRERERLSRELERKNKKR